MTDEIHSQIGDRVDAVSAEDKILELVTNSNALLLSHIASLTTEKGSGLSLDELRKAAVAVQRYQADKLDVEISAVWRECKQIADAARWENVRKFHLNRLLVQCFSDLFPDYGKPVQQGLHLSRRIIPGFLAAIQQMLGDDLYVQLDGRAKALVDSYANAPHGIIPWEDVYRNAAGLLIVEDVLIYAARYFTDMVKRRNWMIDVVDSHLPPAGHVTEKVWSFGNAEFHLLMNAVYGPLSDKSASESGWTELNQRYDEHSLEFLRILFTGLERDYQELTTAGLL